MTEAYSLIILGVWGGGDREDKVGMSELRWRGGRGEGIVSVSLFPAKTSFYGNHSPSHPGLTEYFCQKAHSGVLWEGNRGYCLIGTFWYSVIMSNGGRMGKRGRVSEGEGDEVRGKRTGQS